ncbi:MAG: hypothetical protein IPK13_25910 [Deltaproteobacteria bacterium]|nr:hypothetical protein [Deltaproteobacteria bacterium]
MSSTQSTLSRPSPEIDLKPNHDLKLVRHGINTDHGRPLGALAAGLGTPTPESRRAARRGQRARKAARQQAVVQRHSQAMIPLRLDRLGPIVEVLRRYREAPSDGEPLNLLEAYADVLEIEVRNLEAYVESAPRSEQRRGSAIRQALDFLSLFGRIASLEFAFVPVEERSYLIRVLELEHRWCYAAAGTTRAVFKRAIGRTGAR